MKVFCDMDGVLADFDAHHESHFGWRPDKKADDVDWAEVRKISDFYLNIPPMADMQELWTFLKPLNPIILTGVPLKVTEAADNKRAWVVKNIGSDVEVRCCRSSEKCLHAEPGDILIDDWEKYRSLWEKKGGQWVTHYRARTTIKSLLALGVGLDGPIA